MPQVILQPTGNPDGRKHFVDTIENPIRLADYKSYLTEGQLEHLAALHPSGLVGLWGVTPGGRNVNVGKWERIDVGDIALFATDNFIHTTAVVTYKTHSPGMARAAWGENTDGETWEYVYTVAEIKKVKIPYLDFNRAVGYQDNYIIQGFNVLDTAKSEAFLQNFGLISNMFIAPVDESEYEEAIQNLDGPLDRQAKVWQRAEQGKARKSLLGDRSVGTCFLCGSSMASEFLIAAHIKKRSLCSDDEKRDLSGVMMLACRFGCDYLFEQGHIGVDDEGFVRVSNQLTDESAHLYLANIADRQALVREAQKIYFQWHWENKFLD